ncbi:MAG TPA: transporter substrate-binding domain-containing protein [Burkholderiales bacterium]|nr:transporter substrate-binding domain-containing protein [Burkholderiales bacterium]
MRAIRSFALVTLVLLLNGCAGTSPSNSAQAREALAPTGKLRAGFLATAPTHAVKDPASGELRGPAMDLGRELARQLGVPFEAVPYTSFPPLLEGAKSGAWDVAFMGTSAERAQVVDFTPPYMIVQFSYLVPKDSALGSPADIDRAGVRIAVLEKSSPDAHLSRTVRNATIVRLPTLGETVQAIAAGGAHAAFGTKAGMLAQAAKVPGSRVLDGEFGGEETAMALPKGRAGAAAHARDFVEAAKAGGLVKAAIDKAQLRGVVVAPRP